METYYYVIYMRYGPARKSGGFSGAGAEQSAERAARSEFENLQRMFTGQVEGPTRYEVRRGSPY